MPRGVPKNRASGTVHVVDWYQLYYDWWDSGCNIEQILYAYKLYDKTKSNGTPRDIWRSNKYNHKKEYQEAKEAYFQDQGVTRSSLILRLNDLSQHARSDMVKLDATKYLYEILDKIKDSNTTSQAQKLIIQFEESNYEGESGI